MLTFPTMAEQTESAFRTSTKTISIGACAKSVDPSCYVEKFWHETGGGGVRYHFDDDTTLETRGRGSNHRIETHLP